MEAQMNRPIDVDKLLSGPECVVCGDKSSGKHYGQLSCEGCKSFFKRSIRRSINYTCRGSKSCTVDINHRNQCQYCRFKKCERMGMRKEAVQRGRLPLVNQHSYSSTILYANSIDSGGSLFKIIRTDPANSIHYSTIIAQLVHAEPYTPSCSSSLVHIDSIYEFGAKLLFYVVEWARSISLFNQLNEKEQLVLLQTSWAELFVVNATQLSIPPHIATLLAASEIKPLIASENLLSFLDHIRLFQCQVERLKTLNMDALEFSSFKGIILFSADSSGLTDLRIENIQDKIQAALEDYCRLQKQQEIGRFGRILLRLPMLRSISSKAIEQLFFSKLIGKTPINSLLRDMLYTQNDTLIKPSEWHYQFSS